MKHVLVVEDDAYNAILVRKVLERRGGFEVTVTESVEEILELTRTGAVRVVILDVSLGNSMWHGKPISGVEICQMLKSDPRTVGIPVMLATAHAMRGDAEKLLMESGADDYVAKPILDQARFVDQVRGLLAEAA